MRVRWISSLAAIGASASVLLGTPCWAAEPEPQEASPEEAGAQAAGAPEVDTAAPPMAWDYERYFDALVLRPLSAAKLVTGFGMFTAGLPLFALAWDLRQPWDMFVRQPYQATFETPLGAF